MASLCGQFMHQLKACGLDSSLLPHIIHFFEWLIGSESGELRRRAAYNFSYFFSELYPEAELVPLNLSESPKEGFKGK